MPSPREPNTSKSGCLSFASLQMISLGSPLLNHASQSTCHQKISFCLSHFHMLFCMFWHNLHIQNLVPQIPAEVISWYNPHLHMTQYEANNLVQGHEDRKIMKRCKDLNRIYRSINKKGKRELRAHVYREVPQLHCIAWQSIQVKQAPFASLSYDDFWYYSLLCTCYPCLHSLWGS